MPSRASRISTARQALLRDLADAGRAQSTASVMFHTRVAAHLGLTPTEEKALELLDRHGPQTAGELAERTGLAPPSITGLVDRLERKGFARRVADAADRRRVRIERDESSVHAIQPLLGAFSKALEHIYSGFSDKELAIILRFLREVAEAQHTATASLQR